MDGCRVAHCCLYDSCDGGQHIGPTEGPEAASEAAVERAQAEPGDPKVNVEGLPAHGLVPLHARGGAISSSLMPLWKVATGRSASAA